MKQVKEVLAVQKSPSAHWVGDGFPVRSLISFDSFGGRLNPFLLLDYGGPVDFPPTQERKGVGEHPHRGFETVTIVYQGELEHRDSTGSQGRIGPGDVQWMTAAAGIVHEEKHAKEFAERGGTLEMVQLWVNLPAKDKMSPPGYQTLLKAQIPTVALPDEAGTVRIIAGDYEGVQGAAKTFTPVNVWDIRLHAGKRAEFALPAGYATALIVLKGKATINGSDAAGETELVLLAAEGEQVSVEAGTDVTLLLLSGEPIREPMANYGPFVMNTEEELKQAFTDYRNGKMGHLA